MKIQFFVFKLYSPFVQELKYYPMMYLKLKESNEKVFKLSLKERLKLAYLVRKNLLCIPVHRQDQQ